MTEKSKTDYQPRPIDIEVDGVIVAPPDKSAHAHNATDKKLLKGIGAVLAVGLLGAMQMGSQNTVESLRAEVTTLSKELEKAEDARGKEIEARADTREEAIKLAKDYSWDLGLPKNAIPMRVINGDIVLKSSGDASQKGAGLAAYKNPIILSQLPAEFQRQDNGGVLDGAWLGIQGKGPKNRVEIFPLRFDPEIHELIPNDPSRIDFPYAMVRSGSPQVGMVPSDGSRYLIPDILYAQNSLIGVPLTNPDGAAVHPGMVVEAD